MGKWFQGKSFSTRKREQGINARKIHRALGILLAAALIFQTMPFEGSAVSASENRGGGLCEHHTEHTPDCGYQEAEPGHECTHEHTDDCYRTVEEEGSATKKLDCHHEHDESCEYQEAVEESPCTFVCEICNGETQEKNMDNNGINDGDSENPGTESGNEIKELGNGQEECICKELCVEDSINKECPMCGAEDASLSDCKGKDTEENTEDAEENAGQQENTGFCKHHSAHDAACGYIPESESGEGSPCTYECRICPIEKLIAALPDAADIRSDNADKVQAQLEEILALYRELTEDEQEQIDMIRCYELQGTLDEANVSMLAESHTDRQEGDVVSVTVDSTTTYYADISEAWTAATAADSPVTVTLLGDVISSKRLDVGDGCDITITSIRPGNKLLCTDIWEAFQVKEGGRLVIEDGTFEATSKNGVGCACVAVRGGEAVIKGGTYLATTTASGALYIGGGKLEISGGLFESFNVASGKSVTALNHVSGEVNISGGIFRAKGTDGGGIYIWKEDAIANISGGIFEGGRYGMAVEKGTVSISGGTFVGGEDIALGNLFNSSRYTLRGFLKNYGDNSASEHYAYFDQNDNPITKGLDKGSRIMETVTVKVCEHKGENVCEYMHTEGTSTHQKACLACGMVENSEKCSFDENGKCPCGAVLAVALPDNLALTYTGKEQKPAVTVTVDGRTLAAENNYEVNYSNNINAGTDTAKVTVTGTAFTGTFTKTFFIGKATPKIEWNSDNRELTYTGQPADIKPVITLVNGEKYTGEIHYSWYGVADSLILPTDAGTYINIKASIPEHDNYNAAITKIGLNLYIVRADQDAPDAPTATEDNIKDNSITLDTIENAEYSKDGTNWQESPQFTGLDPNQAYTFYARLKEDDNHNASLSSAGTSITTKKTMLENGFVTALGYTYTGAAIVPPANDVVVMLNEKRVDSGQYTISASNNVNAGMATLTVTATESGDYSGSVSSTFIINRADLTVTASDQSITYGGNIAQGTGQATATGLCGGDTLGNITLTASTTEVPGGTIMPSAVQIRNNSGTDVTANYKIAYETGKLTVSYMKPPAAILYNGGAEQGWYNEDVKITADSYTVSDTLGGDYEASYTISAQQGTVTKTLYFKDGAGHMSDGVEVTVKFDLTPPTGEIAVGMKWWQNVLNFISFGNYAPKAYTVSIKAEDTSGSGIEKIEYVIVPGSSQYTAVSALEAAGLSWTEYDSSDTPTVDANTSQYVVYARLTDNAGNVTYISTDGILLDNTPPAVRSLSVPEDTKKDVTAGVTFTVSEAADYYYVVLPQGSATPDPKDIIVTCGGTLPDGKIGTAIDGTVDSGKGAVSGDTLPASVSVEAKNLQPNTAYIVYVTAVDRAVDITNSAEGKPAGNIADVVNAGFTTKKTLPVIIEAPKVTGTYGQSVGEMTVTGGTAKDGSTILTGTWTVSDTDKDRTPSAGTAEKVTVIFTPDNAGYDSVSVPASLTVEQAAPDVGTVTANVLENTLDRTQVILSRTNQRLAGTLTLTDNTLKYGTNTYTWEFTPDDTVNYKTVTGKVQITVNDTIPPTAQYQIGTDGWKQFINTVSFGLFYKDYQTVTIRGTDDTDAVKGSGISLTQYFISDREITDIGSIVWSTYMEPLDLNTQGTYFIYVKVTDNAGNTAVLNSEGIVVYGESVVSPAAIDYIYKENRDCTVQFAMNGNTFKGFTDQEGNAVDTKSYTIGSDGTLTLNAAYLDTLEKGEYIYTVSMNPQGIETEQVTLAYPLTVNVKAKELTVIGAEATDRDYDGTKAVEITAVTLSGVAPKDEVAVDLKDIRGMLSSANAGTYTEVTLPELTLTGKDSGNYILVPPAAAVPTSVTIASLRAVITVGTDAYIKTFGDEAFPLDVTENNTEADVQYEVIKGTDVVSVKSGTVTIQNAGEAEIKVSLPASTNYSAAESKTITVTVNKKSGYTVDALNRSYYYEDGGTESIDLAALLPAGCGKVTYGEATASGDVTYSASPVVSGGKLSYTLNGGKVNEEGTISIPIETQNYEDMTITVNVKLTDQIPVSLKDGIEVTLKNHVLTYGEPLSKLVFNGAEFVTADGKTVAGTLAWKEAAATPNAGTVSAVWRFTPAEDKYASLVGTAAITVNKATPTISAAPTVAERVYNPQRTLKEIDLSGGMVTGVDGKELEGGWSWQSADIVPTVTGSGYEAVFTPKDITNYETVSRTITVNVTKAVPYIAGLPVAAEITYGETLNDSVLSGGIVQYGNGAGQAGEGAGNTAAVAGTFTWKEPATKPAVTDSNVTEYTVVFTPSDRTAYHSVETEVKLTVNKAENAPNMPGSTMDVSNSLEKVGDIPLPEGWEWQISDIDTALEVGKPVRAVAVYIGTDKGNYEKETVMVAITRSACDHVAGDVLYTGAGEMAPTCTKDGLGHRECIKCGKLVEAGIVEKALGHTGGRATCAKRAVCTRCGQPYGNTDGSNHGDTEVRGIIAATCTAGGYAGDTYCMDCGEKTKTGNATPALGHDYTSTVTKEPTMDSEGTRTYTCTRCGHSYTRPIEKLPGNDTTKPGSSQPGEDITKPGSSQLGNDTTKPESSQLENNETKSGSSQPREEVTKPGTNQTGEEATKPETIQSGDNATKPGSDQPGDTEPDDGSREETRPETGIPFIKDEDGKIGWDVIRAEEEKAEEGSIINVDMNGTRVVPGDIFDSIKGKDITITFDMGSGIIWSVDGKSITTDKAGDIDFSVKTETNAIPVDILNKCLPSIVTGERYRIQISLAYEGQFGFTAVLFIGLGRENAGHTASLYYYNESTGELEFICANTVAEDGTVSLAFTHASDYVIVIDGDEEESGSVTEPAQLKKQDEDSTGPAEESPQTGQTWRPWWLIVAGALMIIMGMGVFFVVKKKGKDKNSGQNPTGTRS